MHNKSLYNRLSFVLVALFYLSFYLVSPFFHFHHEDSIRDEEKIDYHSHLLNEVKQNKNSTECHHTIDQDDEHNHPIVINAVITNLPPRSVVTPNSSFISFDLFELIFQEEISETKYTEDFHFGIVLKEKCVLFASNVSPPFVLAS